MAFDYSGTSQNHSRTDLPVSTYPYTVSVWVNGDNVSTGTIQTLWNLNDGVGLDLDWLFIDATGGDCFVFTTTDGGATLQQQGSGGNVLSNGTWGHVCGSFNTANRRISVNGSAFAANTTSYTLPAGLTDEEIAAVVTTNNEFAGLLAEIAVWDVELTQAECDMLAAGYSALFVRPQSLVSYRPFIRDTSDRIRGNTMTAGGSPTVAAHPPIIYPSSPALVMAPAVSALTASGTPSADLILASGTAGIASSVVITDVNTTESWTDGDTGLIITGTGFV